LASRRRCRYFYKKALDELPSPAAKNALTDADKRIKEVRTGVVRHLAAVNQAKLAKLMKPDIHFFEPRTEQLRHDFQAILDHWSIRDVAYTNMFVHQDQGSGGSRRPDMVQASFTVDGGFELDLVVADLLGLKTYDDMMKVWVTELLTKHVQNHTPPCNTCTAPPTLAPPAAYQARANLAAERGWWR